MEPALGVQRQRFLHFRGGELGLSDNDEQSVLLPDSKLVNFHWGSRTSSADCPASFVGGWSQLCLRPFHYRGSRYPLSPANPLASLYCRT